MASAAKREGAVDDDPPEPGLSWRVAAVARPFAESPSERLLHSIVCELLVGDDGDSHPQEPPVVASVDAFDLLGKFVAGHSTYSMRQRSPLFRPVRTGCLGSRRPQGSTWRGLSALRPLCGEV